MSRVEAAAAGLGARVEAVEVACRQHTDDLQVRAWRWCSRHLLLLHVQSFAAVACAAPATPPA